MCVGHEPGSMWHPSSSMIETLTVESLDHDRIDELIRVFIKLIDWIEFYEHYVLGGGSSTELSK